MDINSCWRATHSELAVLRMGLGTNFSGQSGFEGLVRPVSNKLGTLMTNMRHIWSEAASHSRHTSTLPFKQHGYNQNSIIRIDNRDQPINKQSILQVSIK